MATIEKRKLNNGIYSYRVKVRLKGYPIQIATFDKLSLAKKWEQSTEAAIREGRYFKSNDENKYTVKDLIDRYIKDILSQKKKSYKNYKRSLEWWKSNIGELLLCDITPSIIIRYRNQLMSELSISTKKLRSPATINNYCICLSHAFSIAVKEWEWMNDNPMSKIKKLKEPRGRVRYLSDEERELLLEACKKSQSKFLYMLVIIALSTGARRMELLSLKWKNVDLERGLIFLHDTKNKERRSLPLVSIAGNLMKEHYNNRNSKTDLVFPGNNLKNPINITTAFKTALNKAKIKDFKWHDLRHSCASYLAMNGATTAEIAGVLGHKTLDMVKRYAHLSEPHTVSVVTRMNNKIFGDKNVN